MSPHKYRQESQTQAAANREINGNKVKKPPFAGSLRAGSYNRALLRAVKEMVYRTVSILCIVAWMFHNGNIITN
jgi:hypothetical protein